MTTRPILRASCWLLTATLSLSLSGCFDANVKSNDVKTKVSSSASDKMPDWVISPPRDNAHLYGVGSAPRIDNLALAFTQAEQNGNAQIAQQLRTQVSQINTQDTQVSNISGQDEQVTRIQSAYTQVKTTPIILKDTVNEARYADIDYVYALQSIDRTQMIAKLRHALTEFDDSIRQQASKLSTSLGDTPSEKDWRIYMQLIPLFAERKQTATELSLYAQQSGSLAHSDKDILAIEAQTNNALTHFGFDTSNTSFPQALASALSSYGLTPKADSTFRLESKTNQHQQTQNGRFYVFEEGTLTLLDPTGSQLGAWTVSGRGIATDQASAEQQARMDWSNQAIKAMFAWLTHLDS